MEQMNGNFKAMKRGLMGLMACFNVALVGSFFIFSNLASAQSPKPLILIHVEVDGQSANSADGVINAYSSRDKTKSVAVGDDIKLAGLITPATAVLTMRSLNGSVIRLSAASQLASSTVRCCVK